MGIVMRHDGQSAQSARVVSVAVNRTWIHRQCGVSAESDKAEGNDRHLLRDRESEQEWTMR